MKSEFVNHIAEVEGIKTPTGTRSKTQVETSFKEFTKKRASKKAKTASAVTKTKSGKAAPKAPAKKSDTPKPVSAISIDRVKISKNPGNTVAAGYDAKSKTMHVEFAASVYEYPNTPEAEFKAWEKTFTQEDVDSGSAFRKAFRGREFRKLNLPVVAKAAATKADKKVSEVSK